MHRAYGVMMTSYMLFFPLKTKEEMSSNTSTRVLYALFPFKRTDFYAAILLSGPAALTLELWKHFERFARIWKPSAWRQEKAGSTLGSNGAKRWSKETQKV